MTDMTAKEAGKCLEALVASGWFTPYQAIALRTILTHGYAPPGFALVPDEITPAMAAELERNFAEPTAPSQIHVDNWQEAYRAMIATYQKEPQG